MNEEKKVPFKWEYGEETISLQLGMYANNQRLYIGMITHTQTQNIPSRFIPARPTMPLERTTAPSTGLTMTPFTAMCCGKSGNVPELP